MIQLKSILLIIFTATGVFAQGLPETAADPYNNYQWNRKNVLRGVNRKDTHDWYEWWYFKVVAAQTGDAFLFTYGVTNPWDAAGKKSASKAFLQFGSFHDNLFLQQDFSTQQFSADYNSTNVRIAENTATDQTLSGQMIIDGHNVSWRLQVQKNWGFDAMGWMMPIENISNIYWYPAQASAAMTGWVNVDGKVTTLNNAPAYQDRNWGRTFPKWWTWLTSNHFSNSPDTTLAAGGGRPKAFNKFEVFSGLCIGLHHIGVDYVFRSTDLDSVRFNIRWGVWQVSAENSRNQKIEISAYAAPEKFLILPFQSPQGRLFYDYETLLGDMTVELYTRSSPFSPWQRIAHLETHEAGIEWGSPKKVDWPKLFMTEQQL